MADIWGLVANLWHSQSNFMITEDQLSSIRTFTELIGDALCLRVVRVWIDQKLKERQWIA